MRQILQNLKTGETEIADVPWLARERAGLSWAALIGRAREWQKRRYDLVINLEPDIRSNVLAWLVGARRRVGYRTGGGGALLTDAVSYDTTIHVATNASRLVDRAAGVSNLSTTTPAEVPPLRLPEPARARYATSSRLQAGFRKAAVR